MSLSYYSIPLIVYIGLDRVEKGALGTQAIHNIKPEQLCCLQCYMDLRNTEIWKNKFTDIDRWFWIQDNGIMAQCILEDNGIEHWKSGICLFTEPVANYQLQCFQLSFRPTSALTEKKYLCCMSLSSLLLSCHQKLV